MLLQLAVLASALGLSRATTQIVTGATLFVGGSSPVVKTSYAQFQGRNDDNTGTSNYLGSCAPPLLPRQVRPGR